MTITGKRFDMCVEDRNLTWTLMLLFLSGALCTEWKVEYGQQSICAVNGSSVVFPCLFYYPDKQTVHSVMWAHERCNIYEGPFIIDGNITNTSSRFQYIGDKQHNCSFKIHQVEHDDSGKYTFRFVTDSPKGQWTGRDGATLKVVDFKVLVTSGNRTTNEGDSVNLTCVNGCDGGNRSSAFTWFKNGEPINEGHALYLSNVSSANSGNYTCSLKTRAGTTSRGVHIDVEYGPKNTSVSVRPSMEVDAGSSITLMCSSHANPPVENYTWLKIDDDDDVVAVGQESVFVSGDGGQYLCSATNKHGSQNSSVVTLRIKQYSATFNKGVLIIAAVMMLLILTTTVTTVRRLNKKKTRVPEIDCEDTQNTDYVNWSIFDNNQSQEGNWCEGATDVIYTTVDFHTKRKPNMEQRMDSHNDDGIVTYSTVCRSQLLNPTYI